ncbi:MAG TPA: hypothetical protein VES65_11520 [Solirubrobacteraceae bacterium]|nr:hypothetical protein [Solirubrobacteraceae bacterium]
MTDLIHDVLDVPFVGQQRDRDVCAPQRVGCRVRQRRHAPLDQFLGGQLGGVANDLLHPAVAHPAALQVGDQIVLGTGRGAEPAQAVDVLDHDLDEVWAHLDLADARLGLRVRDVEAGALGVVQPYVPDLDVAQLAGARASTTEDLDDHPPTHVSPADLQSEAPQVVAHGGLGEAELGRDALG